jgi:hypothetical protein
MTPDTENSQAPDAAGATPPPEAAAPKGTRKPAKPAAKARAPKPDEAPIPLDLVLPAPLAERGFELDEDPVHDPVPTIQPETYVAAVFEPHQADFAVAKAQADLILFDPTQLAELPTDLRLRARLVDLTTPEGLATAEEQKERFRQLRLATERTHKRYKEPFLRTGKLIDTAKNKLVEGISGCEDRFGNAIKAEQERQDAEREQLVQLELARVAALRQRIEDIRAVALQAYGKPAAVVRELIAGIEAIATDHRGQGRDPAGAGRRAGRRRADRRPTGRADPLPHPIRRAPGRRTAAAGAARRARRRRPQPARSRPGADVANVLPLPDRPEHRHRRRHQRGRAHAAPCRIQRPRAAPATAARRAVKKPAQRPLPARMYQSRLANRWVNLMRRLYRWLGK